MKQIFTLVLVFAINISFAQQHKLIKLWESDTIDIPESVLYVKRDKLFFTSLNGKGGIAKVSLDGQIIVLFGLKILNTLKAWEWWEKNFMLPTGKR